MKQFPERREGLLLIWTILALLLVTTSGLMIALTDDRAIEGMGIVLNVVAGAMVCPLLTFLFDWITAPKRRAEIQQALAAELDNRGINRESLGLLAFGVLVAGSVIATIIFEVQAEVTIALQGLAVVVHLIATAGIWKRRSRQSDDNGTSDESP